MEDHGQLNASGMSRSRAFILSVVSMTTGDRVAIAIAISTGVAILAQYLYITAATIGHPFQLEWMEGGMLEVAARVRDGEPLYVAPSVDYVPYIYPPLYFTVVAALSPLLGLELWTARLVSFCATVGVAVLAFDHVRRVAGSRWLAACAPALFVATYELAGRWLHVARVDTLALYWLFASMWALRFGDRDRSAIAAGLLAGLAFATKQSALFALAPAMGIAALVDRRRSLIALGTFAAAAIVPTALFQTMSGGWYLYYLFELPGQHELVLAHATTGLATRLAWLSPALLVVARALVLGRGSESALDLRDVGVILGLTATALISFVHSGAYQNVLLPMLLAIAIATPIAIARLRLRPAIGALVVTVQLGVLTQPTAASLPEPGATASGERFLSWIGAREGELLLPDHGWLQRSVGKRSSGLGMAARDVLRAHPDDRGRTLLEASLRAAFRERRFATLVLSDPVYLHDFFGAFYRPAGEIDLAPVPVTGAQLVPRYVLVPREKAGRRSLLPVNMAN